MPVTLGDGPSGTELFCGGRKNGSSSFHELSAGGGGADGAETAGREGSLKNCVNPPSDGAAGAAGAGEGAGTAGRDGLVKNCVKLPSDEAGAVAGAGEGAGTGGRRGLLKNWVKPPSPEAESDTPGEENPLEREGPAGVPGRGDSSEGRAGGVYDGVPGTKILVNSPGAPSGDGCAGPLTTCVASWGGASRAGGVAAGRWAALLKTCVNSPGGAEALDGIPAPGPAASGDAGFAGWGGNTSAGFASLFPSCSKARRNMPVALSGSGCSGPELEFLLLIESGPVPRVGRHPRDD